jgi:acyl-CoA reductase-like NAD-dependent aldehyde dehydrogenase
MTMTLAPTPVAEERFTADDRMLLDQAIDELRTGAGRWVALSLRDRAALLRRTHDAIHDHSKAWATVAINAKNTPAPLAGEEWLTGPYVVAANVDALATSLERLADGRSPAAGLSMSPAPNGGTAVRVMPGDLKEGLLFHGFSGALWTVPGTRAQDVFGDAGLGARDEAALGGVGLVLGAGNISGIGPLDVLYELVAHNRTSLLKLNPTFASLRPTIERAFAPLVEAGLMRVVNGGAFAGAYLTQHDGIDHVHITGSATTHDAIVWGVGDTAQANRQAGTPVLKKEITSELGGVSPVIVIPGEWSDADLQFQAEHVATQRLHNSGHNCIATQLIIVSSDWPQREKFLDRVRAVLGTLDPRAAWYPGSNRKLAAAKASYPDAESHQGRLFVEVGDGDCQDLLTTEYFAPVLGHTTLPGNGVDFFRDAVAFANDELYGTLGASIVVKPSDRAAIGPEFDKILADLRYGNIGINAWSAIAFLVPALPWGAFPGHTIDDVGSGIGTVHNAHLIANVERSVITGPFRPFPRSLFAGELAMSPKPGWFVTARGADTTARRLAKFEKSRSWRHLPAVVAAAIRG